MKEVNDLVDQYFSNEDSKEALSSLEGVFLSDYIQACEQKGSDEALEDLDKLWHELAGKINKRLATKEKESQDLLSTDEGYGAKLPAPIKKTGFIAMLKRCNAID